MNKVTQAWVEAEVNPPKMAMRPYGGPIAALRAYQHWHPYAAIYTVTYRDRTVWMTSKQYAIWHEVNKYWMRGKPDKLQRIADVVGCSRATVSRFLRRLDLWRFLTLVTQRGRRGFTIIITRALNEPFKRWTMKARERVRLLLAEHFRKQLAPQLEKHRLPKKPRVPWWLNATQGTLRIGSTDATFK